MKRLILLTLVAIPLAIQGLATPPGTFRGTTLRPRIGRHAPVGVAPADAADALVVRGYPMSTPERAIEDGRARLLAAVQARLAARGVPRNWVPPAALLDTMIRTDRVEVDERDYGTVYIQTLHLVRLDGSGSNEETLIEAYERELAGHRLLVLAEILAFVLVCLAAVSGYVRADEATKGYYTAHLRVATVACVGAAGTVLYHVLR